MRRVCDRPSHAAQHAQPACAGGVLATRDLARAIKLAPRCRSGNRSRGNTRGRAGAPACGLRVGSVGCAFTFLMNVDVLDNFDVLFTDASFFYEALYQNVNTVCKFT